MRTETEKMIGGSPEFRRVLNAAQLVAATDATVLLLGESGTGKELLARSIHRCSLRAERRFVAVSCAGIPEGIVESELFSEDDPGRPSGERLQNASSGSPGVSDGTLFLDEVGELPRSSQAKLLGFLEKRESPSLPGPGSSAGGPRIIAAASGNLLQAVEQGQFSADLYYRLCVVPLELPPLRARSEDVLPLLDRFLSTVAQLHGVRAPALTAAARRAVKAYHWPGNVRELRNLCERLAILFPGRTVDIDNLPLEVRRGAVREGACGFELPASGINLQDLEVSVIRQALALTGGNKSRAARLLGLTRDTLLYRLQKYLIAT